MIASNSPACEGEKVKGEYGGIWVEEKGMMNASNSCVPKGGMVKEESGGIWGEEERIADCGGMVQSSPQRHV